MSEEAHGVPSNGDLEKDGQPVEPLGRPGLRHWKQSTISDPSLDERGSIYFAAIEMTRMPMILTDPNQEDNPIVFANNAFFDLTGYVNEEVLGRNCRFLQGPETDVETVQRLREAVENRQAISTEILNYRRDGTTFWNGIFIGPVFGNDGNLLYFFASQLDVTRRRESEQAFRQAQKMEAIGQLTAGIAHDFNNLLHVVTGSLERMSSRRSDEHTFNRYFQAAMAATERGAKLTRQLLAFARRSRLEPQRIDMTTLVNSIAELLDSSVGSKVELQMNLRRRLPQVMVDPVHLEMALLNIVINARDASRDGQIVTVSLNQVEWDAAQADDLRPGTYVCLSVKDEGTGMLPHIKARATEPFFTTKEPGEGTGLGLAMAFGFVQQSGGRMDIDTEMGRGTTITMYFPVAADLAARQESEFKPERVDGPGPRILVVDDSHETATLAAEILDELGYRCVIAHSGEEALAAFIEAEEKDPFKLLFTDVVMPGGMNGLVLAEKVRERTSTTPILIATGYNDAMALNPQREKMDVLGKPYRRSELQNRIQAAFRRAPISHGPNRSDFSYAQG